MPGTLSSLTWSGHRTSPSSSSLSVRVHVGSNVRPLLRSSIRADPRDCPFEFGQVIDVFVSARRDAKSARRCFEQALRTASVVALAEVTTDQAPVYPAVLEELLPAAWHRTDRYANNHIECDHGRLKARPRPMRGLRQDRSAKVIVTGHAFVQNVRRGHYEVAVEEPVSRRLAVDELALAI